MTRDKMISTSKLGKPVPVRLWSEEREKLSKYEESGLNISEIIRRCVKKALPEVIAEIREELGGGINSNDKGDEILQKSRAKSLNK